MFAYISVGLATTLLSLILLSGLRYYAFREVSLRSLLVLDGLVSSVLAGLSATALAAALKYGLASTLAQALGGVSLLALIGWLLFSARFKAIWPQRLKLSTDAVTDTIFVRYKVLRFLESTQGSIVMAALFGFLLTVPMWQDNTNILTDVPPRSESHIYMYLFPGMIAASLIMYWICSRRSIRRLPSGAALRRIANYAFFVPGVIGSVVALIQTQTRNITLANRYYIIGVLTWAVIYFLWSSVFVLTGLRSRLRAERRHFREQQHHKRKKRRR